jgi:uncharacterized protein (UPF0212 family)
MATKTILTDQELINAFNGSSAGKTYEATFIPEDAPYPSVDLWDIRVFNAQNKAEATRIAREYGNRIIAKKMIYVYVANRGVGLMPRG